METIRTRLTVYSHSGDLFTCQPYDAANANIQFLSVIHEMVHDNPLFVSSEQFLSYSRLPAASLHILYCSRSMFYVALTHLGCLCTLLIPSDQWIWQALPTFKKKLFYVAHSFLKKIKPPRPNLHVHIIDVLRSQRKIKLAY